ncbi:hypothetical protein [Nocardioides panacisoli]|uniref:Mce-associated membrane protein n=1 Tax=Nocardioides panacisoli TaxID=627624 RepID=A0ABP7IBK4_9ACTN
MRGSRVRLILLCAAAVVAVICLVAAGLVFFGRSAGDGLDLGDRYSSLRDDEVPASGTETDREAAMSAARTFVTRFNTYSPDMLDAQNHLPEYEAVSDLMTSKFATVFDKNVRYAELTVQKLGVTRSAKVFAVGVASEDSDSAEVLVAGTAELSYPYPDQLGQQTSDDKGSGDSKGAPQVSSGPQRFRYQVSLVKVGGRWLVDDLDDVDDGKPPFSQPVNGQTPGATPSGAPTPSGGSKKGKKSDGGGGQR